MLLPTVMLLVGLLVQPVCLLYTRSVMRSAAAECARALLSADDEAVRAFALRRLAAVPEVPPFHVGGEKDWEIELTREGDTMTVGVSGHARPLPLLGILASSLGENDGTGVVLRVREVERMRASWVGGDYDDWVAMWG